MLRLALQGAALLALVGACAGAARAQVPQAPATPQALAQALDKRYRTIKDFSADFVQTYRGGALRTQARERGTVKIRKPGQMRWMYENPEKKEFVSDGHTIYSYFPADRQVMVSKIAPDMEAGTPALFLAGKADFARDYVAAAAPSPVEGTAGLKLTPRRPEPNVEYFVVAVDHLPMDANLVDWQSVPALEALAASGRRVKLGPRSQTTLDLRLTRVP